MTQLSLDRCVGRKALSLRGHLISLEVSNLRMQEIRASILAAQAGSLIIPGAEAAVQALKILLRVQYAEQELRLVRWQVEQGGWMVGRGCDDLVRGAFPLPLPSMGWRRPPEDPLGPRPLERSPSAALKIELLRPPRRARAEVSQTGSGGWRARWF